MVSLSWTRANPLEEFFMATTHDRARFWCHFYILFTLRTLKNSQTEALCLWKDLCSWKIQNRKIILGKEGKKEYHSVKKEKESFVKVTCTRRAPSWRPDFDHFAPAVASNTQ